MAVALARRYPFRRHRLGRAIVVHAVAGTAIALAVQFAARAVLAWLTGFWTYLLVSTFALNLTIYAIIIAGARGLEHYRLSRERDQLEARLAETRLQLLGMQLQPHFLFNTLNTIAEIVHEDPHAADAMIAHLSHLLRETLAVGSTPQIPLRDELGLLSRYLEIQKVRFGDRLAVTLDVDEGVLDAAVPPLLLQPLAENAIRHGLGRQREGGRLVIAARPHPQGIAISVSDDGDGLRPIHLERVGLGNTRARLEGLYGPRARLELSSGATGTSVTAVIPRAQPA